jgi:uncharacterized membrane protein YbhN (UPF0104 family)
VTRRQRALLRLGLSFALLLALLSWFDGREVLNRLAQMDLRWALPALLLSVLQILLLAWRWQFTAARLGLHMPYPLALREYYLGVFLNQLLPGGVLGDVSRAWRHARSTARVRTAVHAVVLERILLQSVMLFVALISLAALPLPWPEASAWALGLPVLTLGSVGLLWIFRTRLRWLGSAAAELARDARSAFLPGRTLLLQLGSAFLFVLGNLVVFVAIARSLGSTLPLSTLLPLIAPVLLAMMLPVTVAGWGLREAAAALLWGLSGLSATEGIAIAVAYGLLFLLAALPGAWPLLFGNLSVAQPKPDSGSGDQGRSSTSNKRSFPSGK